MNVKIRSHLAIWSMLVLLAAVALIWESWYPSAILLGMRPPDLVWPTGILAAILMIAYEGEAKAFLLMPRRELNGIQESPKTENRSLGPKGDKKELSDLEDIQEILRVETSAVEAKIAQLEARLAAMTAERDAAMENVHRLEQEIFRIFSQKR